MQSFCNKEKLFLNMPTNLNALIRYKQIDACLKNPFAKCTISHLQEICTQSLGENRGIYRQVSVRTIRDDIRVLKSDILGFNAPVVFENGAYIYSDTNFSIFSTPLTEKELLKDVLTMLLEERKNIVDEEVDRLLLRISNIIGEKLPDQKMDVRVEKQERTVETDAKKVIGVFNLEASPKRRNKDYLGFSEEANYMDEPKANYSISESKNSGILWNDIFALIK